MNKTGLIISGYELFRRHGSQLLRVARDLSLLLTQRVFQRALGFVSLYFMVRHLSKDEFGQYQFASVAMAAMGFMTLTGIDNAIMQSISRGVEGLYRRAMRFAFGFSILGGVLLALAAMWFRGRAPETFAPLVVAAVLFPFYSGLCQWKSVLLGQRRFQRLAMIEVSNAAITTGLLVAAVFLDLKNVAVFVGLYLISGAAVNTAMTIIIYRNSPRPEAGASEPSRDLFRYGMHTSAITVVSIVAEQIERLVIFILLSPAALAAYLAGDRISELVRGVVQDAAAVLAPRFAKMPNYSGDITKMIWALSLWGGGLILAFAFTLAPSVLLLIFGEQYSTSVPYAQALLCTVAVGNVGQFQWRFIRSQMDRDGFRDVIICTSGLRIIAALALIPLWGAWGAIASVFANRIALSIACSIVIARHRREAADRAPSML